MRSARSAHALLLLAVGIGCMQTYPDENDQNSSGGTAGSSAGASGTTAAAGTPPSAGTGGVAGSAAGAAGAGGVTPTGGVPSTGGTLAGTAGAVPAGAAGSAGAGGDAVAAGSAGIGGATAGSAGAGGVAGDLVMAGSAGTAAGAAGTAGTAGAAGSAGCSDGCAEVSVPFTAWKAGQSFEIYLNSATDLSAATVSVKLRKVAGKAGGIQIFAKNGSAQMYAYAASSWNEVNALTSEWTTLSMVVATATPGENPFDATVVAIVSVQIAAGDPWYTDETMTMEDPTALVNPTVIQIDEVAITGTTADPAPWTFTSSASPLTANVSADGIAADPPYAIEGSKVTWVGP